MAAIKSLPVDRYSVMLTCSSPKGLSGSIPLFWSRVALNPGLDVASANISHGQAQSKQVCCFETLESVLPNNLFSDYNLHTKQNVMHRFRSSLFFCSTLSRGWLLVGCVEA